MGSALDGLDKDSEHGIVYEMYCKATQDTLRDYLRPVEAVSCNLTDNSTYFQDSFAI